MFFSLGLARVLGVLLVLVLVGFWLMPTYLLSMLVGMATAIGGLVMLPSSGLTGVVLILVGAVLIILGVGIRRRDLREEEQAAEETARSISGTMKPYIPSDD